VDLFFEAEFLNFPCAGPPFKTKFFVSVHFYHVSIRFGIQIRLGLNQQSCTKCHALYVKRIWIGVFTENDLSSVGGRKDDVVVVGRDASVC
jgi:hypothetical protein